MVGSHFGIHGVLGLEHDAVYHFRARVHMSQDEKIFLFTLYHAYIPSMNQRYCVEREYYHVLYPIKAHEPGRKHIYQPLCTVPVDGMNMLRNLLRSVCIGAGLKVVELLIFTKHFINNNI